MGSSWGMHAQNDLTFSRRKSTCLKEWHWIIEKKNFQICQTKG